MQAAILKISTSSFLILVMLFIACHSNDLSKSQSETLGSPPGDFRLVLGEGGGFVGLWSGYSIDSVGAVYDWRGAVAEEHRRLIAHADSAKRARLWHAISDANFFAADPADAGNMTQFISVWANGKVHRVSWPKPREGEVMKPLQQLYESCRVIISQ